MMNGVAALVSPPVVGTVWGVVSFFFSTVAQKICLLAGVIFKQVDHDKKIPASQSLGIDFTNTVILVPLVEEGIFRAALQPLLANSLHRYFPQLAEPVLFDIPAASVVAAVVMAIGLGRANYLYGYQSGKKEAACISFFTALGFGLVKERFGLSSSICANMMHNLMIGLLDRHSTFLENPAPREWVIKELPIKLSIPQPALKVGSLRIQSASRHFSKREESDEIATYALIQKVLTLWKEQGIIDYLFYGKEEKNPSCAFHFEMVPYPKEESGFWQRFQVSSRIALGGTYLTESQQSTIVKNLEPLDSCLPLNQQVGSVASVARKLFCAFCDRTILERQQIFEGEQVRVLYSYAPIVPLGQRLHFLLLPKKHCRHVADLTLSIYLEVMRLSRQLISFYQAQGCFRVYLFSKVGKAGQTVPHWHQHIVIAMNKIEDYAGKSSLLTGAFKLNPKHLQARVKLLQVELQHTFGAAKPHTA